MFFENVPVWKEETPGPEECHTSSIISNNIVTSHPQLTWFWVDWLRVVDVDNDGDKDILTENKFYNLQWRNDNGVFTKY
jgi:hypothetical protein